MLNCYLLKHTVLLIKEFFKHKHLFDFSKFSKDSKFFNETNKKVIGKMRDEFGGVIADEFVRLKSKNVFYEKNLW